MKKHHMLSPTTVFLSMILGLVLATGLAGTPCSPQAFAADTDEEIDFDAPDTTAPKAPAKKAAPTASQGPKTPQAPAAIQTPTIQAPTTKQVPATIQVPAVPVARSETATTPSNPRLGGPRKMPPRAARPQNAAPKTEPVKVAPLEDVVPVSVLMMIRCGSLDSLEKNVKLMMESIGFGAINPIDFLRFGAYGKAIPALGMDMPAAAVYVADDSGGLIPAFYLPTRDFKAFAKALGADVKAWPGAEPVPDKTLLKLRVPVNGQCWSDKGYAVVLVPRSKEEATAKKLMATPSWRHDGYEFFPSALRRSDLSLEITSRGVQRLNTLAATALHDAFPVVKNMLTRANSPVVPADNTEILLAKATDTLEWINRNVECLRIDYQFRDDAVFSAVNLIPLDGSTLRREIANDTVPMVPTVLDFRRFLNVVPDVASPVSGQVDLAQSVYTQLDAPFNRIRHIEYTLSVPEGNELLTESWCFFLEVDDSGAFVEELVVPKATMVGSHIGSERLSELGAQILGNMALRRQARQRAGGRVPRIPADPENAAARGAELGSRLGAEIGGKIGAKQAMTQYNFDGYTLYRADVATYTREMRKINAERNGQVTRPPTLLTGERTLCMLISNVLNGGLDGTLQNMVGSAMNNGGPEPGEVPLLANNNLILVLGPHHLLIVPGNEQMLRMAKDNWERIRDQFLPKMEVAGVSPEGVPIYRPGPRPKRDFVTTGPATQAFKLWERVRGEMFDSRASRIRTVTRIELPNVRRTADYLRTYYAPGMPRLLDATLADDAPSLFVVSTTDTRFAALYSALPHPLTKTLVTMWMEKQAGATK